MAALLLCASGASTVSWSFIDGHAVVEQVRGSGQHRRKKYGILHCYVTCRACAEGVAPVGSRYWQGSLGGGQDKRQKGLHRGVLRTTNACTCCPTARLHVWRTGGFAAGYRPSILIHTRPALAPQGMLLSADPSWGAPGSTATPPPLDMPRLLMEADK